MMSMAFSPANPPSRVPPAPHTTEPHGGSTGAHSALPAAPPAALPPIVPTESATALPHVCSPVAACRASLKRVSPLPAHGTRLRTLPSRPASSEFLARSAGPAAAAFWRPAGTTLLDLSSCSAICGAAVSAARLYARSSPIAASPPQARCCQQTTKNDSRQRPPCDVTRNTCVPQRTMLI